MRRPRTIWLWTVLALFFSLLSPAAQAAWQCEGRTCGTDLWSCCCTGGEKSADDNCPAPRSAANPPSGTSCSTECQCVLTVRADDSRQPAHNLLTLTVPVATLPVQPLRLELPLRSAILASIESRGPPPRGVALETPALRGPPCLLTPPVV